ncbi:hypothetical protein SBRY_20538 [Actinacidiphila bryophytorum]|uniref:Uncharacterized protein n=1 Tax=Actinacidiphila bryophytorum TaxID=1436133 RepID=A0A9W4GY99_9ACTN|nr:hypothetical protein SBRY_20538 [Actinacidiphila bryophytorum]
MRRGGVGDAARLHVAVHPGLVDRTQRAQAHGHGRELPEVRHQPRVRVAGQPVGRLGLLLPEGVQLRLAEPVKQEGAGVDAGRGVALEEDLVAAPAVVLAAEEVVEAHVVERRRRREGRDVAADTDTGALCAGDHHRGVPPGRVQDAPLDLLVAGEERLVLGRDGVHVVGAAHLGHRDALLAGALDEPQHQVAGTFTAALVDGRVQRVEPFRRLLGIEIRDLAGKAANDDRVAIGSGSHAFPLLLVGARCSTGSRRIHRVPRRAIRHLYPVVTAGPAGRRLRDRWSAPAAKPELYAQSDVRPTGGANRAQDRQTVVSCVTIGCAGCGDTVESSLFRRSRTPGTCAIRRARVDYRQ